MAARSVSTSPLALNWPKLTRTVPSGKVPMARCAAGEQCSPVRTAIPNDSSRIVPVRATSPLLSRNERTPVRGAGSQKTLTTSICRSPSASPRASIASCSAMAFTLQVEFDGGFGIHQLRGERAGGQEAVRIVRVTDADMAIGVDDPLPCEDPVGAYEVLDQPLEITRRVHPLLSLGDSGRPRGAAAHNSALI